MNEKIGMQDLVVLLAEKANISRKDAETLVKECFEIMEEGLSRDKLLKIRNLGTFKLVFVEDRESVDVSTGERVLIPAHYKVAFAPDAELAEKVNAPYASLENVELTDNEIEIDDETDDENEDEFEEKLTEPGYFIAAPEIPEIKEEPKIEEAEEIEEIEETPEIEEIEEFPEPIYQAPEREIIEEEEAPTYSEEYEEEDQPARSRNRLLWIFFIIAAIIILLFAGYYLYPLIKSGGWRTAPDSVVVFSYSVNNPQDSDTSKVKTSGTDSEAMQILDSQRAQTSGTQAGQKAKGQKPVHPKAESKSARKTEPAAASKAKPSGSQPPKTFANKKHKVRNGERLNTIALRTYGHKAFWVYIYEENRSKIHNPDLIEPGMTINIPPAEKYGINKNNRESVEKALKLEQQYKR